MNDKNIPTLTSLRAFDVVASHGSFKLAAKELNVTATAISHQIRQLEDALGIKVLQRSSQEVRLTATGERLKEATTNAFELLWNAVASIHNTNENSRISLTATANFISNWLMPRLKKLQLACPSIDMELQASDRTMDLRKNEVDIAIRYAMTIDDSLSWDALYSDEFILVSSPALPVMSINSLKDLPLIHIDGRLVPNVTPDWQAWQKKWGPDDLSTDTGIRFSEETHAIQAAIAGQGVAIVSQLMAKNALQKELLYEPFKFRLEGGKFYFVTTKENADRPEIKQIFHWFKENLNIY